MTGWKKICCAVDFADPSRLAVDQAADLASRFEAELTLVHVVVAPSPNESALFAAPGALAGMGATEREEALARWRVDAEARAGRPVRSRVLAGDPAAEIVRHAVEERCDLVVVGTHGRVGIRRLVLGSVAEHVVRRSPCPVLVVHDHGVLEKEEVARELARHR